MFIFTDDEMFILDDEDTIFERGIIFNVGSEDFDYIIKQQDYRPDLIETDVFGTFTITDSTLSITFWDDDTQTTRFVTFIAERP